MKEACKKVLEVFALAASAVMTWQIAAFLSATRFVISGVNLVALVTTVVMTVTMKTVCFGK